MCCNFESFSLLICHHAWLIGLLVTWDVVWKLVALWKAARNKQLAWFICIAVFNTIGILPIIYILMDMKRKLAKEL